MFSQIFAVPIFGTPKPEKTSVFFCVTFFWDVKNWGWTHFWDGLSVGMAVIESFWDGQGVEFKAKYVFDTGRMLWGGTARELGVVR